MNFPRIMAALSVAFLAIGLASVLIAVLAIGGPLLVHGPDVEHHAGIIQTLNEDQSFILLTHDGQELHFLCQKRCLRQLEHIRRHINEKALTDVYFIREMVSDKVQTSQQDNNTSQEILIAVDVD